jgi:hypothetical protein
MIMEGLKISIPRRLFYIRVCVSFGLIISFLLSLNLWGGERYFPDSPVFSNFFLKAPYDYFLVILSILFLLSSLFFEKSRLFIFLALTVNIFLVLFDLNRLQPWFYVYNAILFVLLFYNGRVDNTGKYTTIFIFIQLIIASVYIYNGINQLNPMFLSTDFYNVISPLNEIVSARQFDFFMKAGSAVPYFIIFIGLGLIIRPTRYLSISAAFIFHLILLILLFPTAKNSNYALWFMNFTFAFLDLFLFSGKTNERYFSFSLLFQKPLFYLVIFAFWIVPFLNFFNYWPNSPTTNFRYGKSNQKTISVSRHTFEHLPLYLKHFCVKDRDNYVLKVSDWCLDELRSEYMPQASLKSFIESDKLSVTSADVKETEEELSSL